MRSVEGAVPFPKGRKGIPKTRPRRHFEGTVVGVLRVPVADPDPLFKNTLSMAT